MILPQPFLHAFDDFLCVIAEEVELHGFGDAENQVAVERGFVENLLDVVAGTADLTCQPAHAALVRFKLGLDEVSDMKVILVAIHDGAKIERVKQIKSIHSIHLLFIK